MVIALSYVFAVLITAVLACILYPIAGVFWLIGLLGKVGEKMFSFSNSLIKKLWADITNKRIVDVSKIPATNLNENPEINVSTENVEIASQQTQEKVELNK